MLSRATKPSYAAVLLYYFSSPLFNMPRSELNVNRASPRNKLVDPTKWPCSDKIHYGNVTLAAFLIGSSSTNHHTKSTKGRVNKPPKEIMCFSCLRRLFLADLTAEMTMWLTWERYLQSTNHPFDHSSGMRLSTRQRSSKDVGGLPNIKMLIFPSHFAINIPRT